MGAFSAYVSRPRARLVFGLAILIFLYLFPWYIPVFLIVAGMLFIRRYYESIALALLIDLLYAPVTFVVPKFGIAFFILFVILEGFLKKRLRLYAKD